MGRCVIFNCLSLIVLAVAFLFPFPGSGHLTLGKSKECGELTCDEYQYCRQHDHSCATCSGICIPGTNNFQKDTCETECQDYLHDDRYQRSGVNRSDNGGNLLDLYEGLQKDVLVLKVLVGISLIVIGITIAAFIAFVVYFWGFLHPKEGKVTVKGQGGSGGSGDEKEKKGKSVEMPTIYNNKYGICHSPDLSVAGRNDLNSNGRGGVNVTDVNINTSPTSSSNTNNSRSDSLRPSPSRSETSSLRTNPGTMSTILNHSTNATTFRREPSESTIPEYMACGADSASLANGIIPYSQHV